MFKKILLGLFGITVAGILAFVLIFVQMRGVVKEHSKAEHQHLGNFYNLGIRESSGILHGRKYRDIYWTHPDGSGLYGEQRNYLFAFYLYDFEEGKRRTRKVELEGASNLDWGDITIDYSGNIIIGDTGGNYLFRNIYVLYRFMERNPIFKTIPKSEIETIQFKFPYDEKYDIEALFYADNSIYLLTKNFGKTKMYRLEEEDIKTDRINIFDYIDEFKFQGEVWAAEFADAVTGAAVSQDEITLAMLTYKGIWIFERDKPGENFFKERISYIPLKWDVRETGKKYEAIDFEDDEHLIITTEQGDIYRVKLAEKKLVREQLPEEKEVIEVNEEEGKDSKGIRYKVWNAFMWLAFKFMDMLFGD